MIELIKNESGEYELSIGTVTLKTGDTITGTIENGSKIEGKLRITDNNKLYFCQNDYSGSKPLDGNILGYNSSWVFNIKNDKKGFTSDVILDYTLEDGSYDSIYRNSSEFIQSTFKVVDGVQSKAENKTLFNLKSHYDCCGAMICYGFDKSNEKKYSLYKNIDIKALRTEIDKIKAAKIIHLASFQSNAHDLMKKLDAKPIHKYINKNSKNEITIYQID